jgi:predicted nucleic acid-binding protein
VVGSPVCLDASFVIRLILDNPLGEKASSHLQSWIGEERPIFAPTLLNFEIVNALYRYCRQGSLTEEAATEALAAALALPIRLYGEFRLHGNALRLARRFQLSAAYDAHYLALAEILGADFWTADAKLVRAAGPSLDWVHLLE